MSECVKCEFTDLMLGEYGSWGQVSDCVSGGLRIDGVEAVDWFFDPVPEGSWDGCHEQGHEGDVYMVFKFKDTHFRVTGTSSSYGDMHWSGAVKEVVPTKVVRTVYEYAEKEN